MATRRKRKNTKRRRSAFTRGGPWTPWRKASKKFKRAQRKARLARLRRRKAGLWGGSRNPRGRRRNAGYGDTWAKAKFDKTEKLRKAVRGKYFGWSSTHIQISGKMAARLLKSAGRSPLFFDHSPGFAVQVEAAGLHAWMSRESDKGRNIYVLELK